ncbi:MAG TPA: cell division protein FtsA [bacterium]|nr:cell division protein FtsA [bacterium]
MKKTSPLIVGLDIGTSNVCAVVAERNESGLEVIGYGTAPTGGMRKGVVVDIEATVDSIAKAVVEAETMARCEIGSVFISTSNGHIKGFDSQGMIAMRNDEVTAEDIARVIDAARAVAIPTDREVLHVLPREFVLDGQSGIKDPVGMQGVRLEAVCHIVTGQAASHTNLERCCHQAGLDVDNITLESLASAEAVLTPEERELGVALIDIGGGTSDLVVFVNDSVAHTFVLGLGGIHVTNDIAHGLHTTAANAEWLKKRYGNCVPGRVVPGEEIEVESLGDREPRAVDQRELCEIIEFRVAEMLHLIHEEILRKELDVAIPAGIVLTGGVADMRGIEELAEAIFGCPVRLGRPRHVGGLVDVVSSPMYAAAVGLVLLGSREMLPGRRSVGERQNLGSVVGKMKGWMKKLWT